MEALGQRLRHQGAGPGAAAGAGCNATWTGDGMLKHKPSDVGVAVAIEGGLFTPVIRDAETEVAVARSPPR